MFTSTLIHFIVNVLKTKVWKLYKICELIQEDCFNSYDESLIHTFINVDYILKLYEKVNNKSDVLTRKYV